jgi:exopolysaccharide/PEP-CTERM locus tyrosine autokinase
VVSLIERAAERLEQLSNQASKAKPAYSELPPVGTPGHPEPTLPERLMQVVETSTSRQEPFLPASDEAEVEPAPALSGSPRTGRVHHLDLLQLAEEGYVTPAGAKSRLANEFRVVKRPLIANAKGKSATPIKWANLIMVTSAMPNEGKSFTAINLALSIAMEMDSTVLLIDGDVAGPSLTRMLHLPPGPGLTEVLSDPRVSVADVLLRTNVPKLTIIPAGEPHDRNTELLASEAMHSLLSELSSRYPDRIIVFDSPPLLPTTESRVLATHMGQIVVVVEANKTTHRQLSEALSTIEACPVVMTMLNKAGKSDVGTYYGAYGY